MRTRDLALVGMLVAPITVGCGAGRSTPSDSPDVAGPHPTTSTTVAFEPGPEDLVLGPDGVLSVKLRMSAQQVARTGLATTLVGDPHEWPVGCSAVFFEGDLVGDAGTTGEVDGRLSQSQGLERISATRRMVLPNGIRIGTTLDEVRAILGRPHLEHGAVLKLPASAGAHYEVLVEDEVTWMTLELERQTCIP